MTRPARKPLVKHAVLWLAARDDPCPVEPQRACACHRTSARDQPIAERRYSTASMVGCVVEGRMFLVLSHRLVVASRELAARPSGNAARTASASADRSHDACCCGSGCKCQVSGRPDQPRDVPTSTTDDGCRRLDVARPLPIATFAARSAGLTGCCIEQPRGPDLRDYQWSIVACFRDSRSELLHRDAAHLELRVRCRHPFVIIL